MLRYGDGSGGFSNPSTDMCVVPSDGSGDEIRSGRQVRCPRCKTIVAVPPDFRLYRCRFCYLLAEKHVHVQVPAPEITPAQKAILALYDIRTEEGNLGKSTTKLAALYGIRTEEGNLGKSTTKLDEPTAGTKSGSHGQTKYKPDEPGNQYVGNKQPEPPIRSPFTTPAARTEPEPSIRSPFTTHAARKPPIRSPFTTPTARTEPEPPIRSPFTTPEPEPPIRSPFTTPAARTELEPPIRSPFTTPAARKPPIRSPFTTPAARTEPEPPIRSPFTTPAARTEEGNLDKSSNKLDEPPVGTKSGSHGQTKYKLDEPGNQYVGNKQPEPSSSQADPNLERKGPRFMTPIRSPVRRSPFTTPPQPKEPNTIGFITSLFKKKRQIDTNIRQPAQPAVQDKTVHLPEEKILESSRSDPAEEYSQEEHQPMSFGLATVFRYQELKAATDCFHPSRELGGGGFGRVYLGKLLDGRTVAVKKLYDDNPKQLEQFFNEVTVLSRVRHQNLVALFGCTNPSSRKKLLLVYEFVPNGTVADHLFGQRPALSWDVRVLIATETAAALAYLHSLEPPIIHRDVKTSNILLDNNFHVKVADLGMCRLLPWDTTYVSTAPQGTMGYRDPDYDVYCKLSDKSDVYSFGVVLLELISGEQAVDVNRDLSDIYLTKMAMNKILNNELEMLVDPKLGYHTACDIKRMINLVAELACNCLEQEGSKRPSMVEVLMTLKAIRDGTQPAQNKLTDINHADDVVRQQENVQLSLDG